MIQPQRQGLEPVDEVPVDRLMVNLSEEFLMLIPFFNGMVPADIVRGSRDPVSQAMALNSWLPMMH